LALLALQAAGAREAPYISGTQWLLARQRSDGGWPPCSPVQTSTSVTSVAALALSSSIAGETQARAVRWLLGQVKPDMGLLQHLEFWMTDMPANEAVMGGSPWFPGNSAWVAPTVMANLAFAAARRRIQMPELDVQVRRSAAYLLSRRCEDGGWNHGGTRFRSPAAFSYPEMTGMALLAVPGESEGLVPSFGLAEQMYRRPGSSEAQSWLHLALSKHGRLQESRIQNPLPCRTTRDVCLHLIAVCAESRDNALLGSTAVAAGQMART
jgi:hypothetical protein